MNLSSTGLKKVRNNCVVEFAAASVAHALSFTTHEMAMLEEKIADNFRMRLGRSVNSKNSFVSEREAYEILPSVLKQINEKLEFRVLKFRAIPFALYREALTELESNNLLAYLGVKSNIFFKDASPENRHLLKVKSSMDPTTLLLEDIDLPEGCACYSWEKIESAVLCVDSGFWVIGVRENLVNAFSHGK